MYIEIDYMEERVASLGELIAMNEENGVENELAVGIYKDFKSRVEDYYALLDGVEGRIVDEVEKNDTTALYGFLNKLMENDDNHIIFKRYLSEK